MLNISQMKIQEPIARWPELAGKKDLDISEEHMHTAAYTFWDIHFPTPVLPWDCWNLRQGGYSVEFLGQSLATSPTIEAG